MMMMIMIMMMTATKTAAAEVLVVEVSRTTPHTATDSMARGSWPSVFYITAYRMLNSAMQSDTYHTKSVFR
jgi:hypothetical protein